MHRPLFLLTGIFAILLAAILLAAPAAYLDLYLVSENADRVFAAQRLSPAIAGLGLLLIILRALEPGPLLSQVCWAAALVWLGVAGTGVFHYLTGVATANILIAAAIEIALGALFALAARQTRG